MHPVDTAAFPLPLDCRSCCFHPASSPPHPAVCASLAVLLDFLLQVTAFVALLALDTKRLEQGRYDCWPWRRWAGQHGRQGQQTGLQGRGHPLAGVTLEQLTSTENANQSACLTCCLRACRARGQPLYDSEEQQEEALLDLGQQGEVADIQEEVEATYGHAYGGRQPGGCAISAPSSSAIC